MASSSTGSVSSASWIVWPDWVSPTPPGSMPPWPASRKTVRWRSPDVGAYSTHAPGSKYLASMARPAAIRRAADARCTAPDAHDDGATRATAARTRPTTIACGRRIHSGPTAGPWARGTVRLCIQVQPYGARLKIR